MRYRFSSNARHRRISVVENVLGSKNVNIGLTIPGNWSFENPADFHVKNMT